MVLFLLLSVRRMFTRNTLNRIDWRASTLKTKTANNTQEWQNMLHIYNIFFFPLHSPGALTQVHAARSQRCGDACTHLETCCVWKCFRGVSSSAPSPSSSSLSLGIAARAKHTDRRLESNTLHFQASDIDCAHDPILWATSRETAYIGWNQQRMLSDDGF